MTVRLSPHKVSRIMRYYFTGISQSEIAGKAGVDQSTVSIYSSRFKEVAAQTGLSEKSAMAKAVEGALQAAEAIGPEAVAEVVESLPEEILPSESK